MRRRSTSGSRVWSPTSSASPGTRGLSAVAGRAGGVAASAAALPFLFKPYWWLCAGLLLLAKHLAAALNADPAHCPGAAGVRLAVHAGLHAGHADGRFPLRLLERAGHHAGLRAAAGRLAVLAPGQRPPHRRGAGDRPGAGERRLSAESVCDRPRPGPSCLAGRPADGARTRPRSRMSWPGTIISWSPAPVRKSILRWTGPVWRRARFATWASISPASTARSEPTLRVLWWGDAQPDARDSQAVFVHGKHGFILVPVRDLATWTATARITRLRINVFDFNPCRQLVLRNVTLYR
ncbi:hypothetical protein LP419_26550 [Massilia sp. H-1]|nr:hypothetical protein LP419_26550 [Massilia sp. H-1]